MNASTSTTDLVPTATASALPEAVTTTPQTREAFLHAVLTNRDIATGSTSRQLRNVRLPYHLAHITAYDVDGLISSIVHYRMSPLQAAETMGIPRSDIEALCTEPTFMSALAAERIAYESCANLTRRDIVDGLLDAAGVAKNTGDGGAMVSAYATIAKVTGLNAPTRLEVDNRVSGAISHVHTMHTLPDAELRKILEQNNDAIDGEVL